MNTLRYGAVAVALVAALSGCAADEQDAAPSTTTTAPTATSPATAASPTTAADVDCPDGAPPVVTPIRTAADVASLFVSVNVTNMYSADIALDVGLKTELGVLVLDGPSVLAENETATYSTQTPTSAPEPTGVNVDVRWADATILDVCPNP